MPFRYSRAGLKLKKQDTRRDIEPALCALEDNFDVVLVSSLADLAAQDITNIRSGNVAFLHSTTVNHEYDGLYVLYRGTLDAFALGTLAQFPQYGVAVTSGGAYFLQVDFFREHVSKLDGTALGSSLIYIHSLEYQARNVVTNNRDVTAYTVASASTNDNVLNALNDVVLLTAQTDVTQNGPWIVGPVVTGVAALSRPPYWPTGNLIPNAAIIRVSEGTLNHNSEWMSFATGVAVIGVTDPLFYPSAITQQVTLVNSAVTVTNVPIASATKSTATFARTTNTGTTLTTNYGISAITPGAIGTASLTWQAQKADGAASTTPDTSVGNLTIRNWG